MRSRGRRRPPETPKGDVSRYLPHAFALLAVVVAMAHFRTQIDSNDEGIAAMGAWRILRGEVPYRDFFAIETPLSFYLVAPLYALFGVSFTVGRVVTQCRWRFFARRGSGSSRSPATIGSPTSFASPLFSRRAVR
jgi:hypothetical protein